MDNIHNELLKYGDDLLMEERYSIQQYIQYIQCTGGMENKHHPNLNKKWNNGSQNHCDFSLLKRSFKAIHIYSGRRNFTYQQQ